jgi:hypothetical protein
MNATTGAVSGLEDIPIRYDGLDAASHQIELNSFGESLQGMARVLAVTGNLIVTGRYVKQYQAQDIRVLVREPEANCVTVHAMLQFAPQQQIFAGVGDTILGALLAWLFGRAANRRDEMKALKDSLDKAIAALASNNQQMVGALTTAVDRMADGLRPAIRQAVQPIGTTCNKMTIGGAVVIDEASAAAIRSDEGDEVGEEKTWRIRITELDLESQSAKVRLADDADQEHRIKARITDPAFAVSPNPYAAALVSQTDISVRAKATLRDGDIAQLYISNTLP